MEHQLETFIESQSLFSKQDRILIAVSGGRDSMVLTHLLHACNFRIALAHVNYQLRGKDSDADAALVEAFAKHLGVPFHSTVAWEKAPEGNLQEAAREVRYQFFEALCAEHAYAFIATAHHLDDRIESLFMHLLRGTGIYGLKGIPVQRGNIVRPMLWADRTMIDAYALQHAVPYRDDTSNETDAYTRNKIRHHLIP
jgi:tRNA(Ile)-lysidine synthase